MKTIKIFLIATLACFVSIFSYSQGTGNIAYYLSGFHSAVDTQSARILNIFNVYTNYWVNEKCISLDSTQTLSDVIIYEYGMDTTHPILTDLCFRSTGTSPARADSINISFAWDLYYYVVCSDSVSRIYTSYRSGSIPFKTSVIRSKALDVILFLNLFQNFNNSNVNFKLR